MSKRIGDWIQTYTGIFYPLDPRSEEINLADIAHSLSLLCRFGGHGKTFLSIAEHSCNVSYLCPVHPLTALLHDASEAYCADLCRPLKRDKKLTFYREMEEKIQKAISEKFNLVYPFPEDIKKADNIMLATEAYALFDPEKVKNWNLTEEPKEARMLRYWYPGQAEKEFLFKAEYLIEQNSQ